LPENVSSILENEELALTSLSMPENLKLGSKGEGVKLLQDFIIETGTGKKTQALSLVGATGYFGELTKGALIEFQESTGIYPAVGYFGPITKNAMLLGMLTDLNPRSLSNTGVDVSRVSIPYFANHDFEIGSSGDGVEWLQGFLIDESRGRNAIALANTGVTGYFGNLTHRALIEYQDTIGIRPASGYYGPITRELLRIN
jgi:peptidoglycan hydrolase-like protein with peptidoglycan-binding domain